MTTTQTMPNATKSSDMLTARYGAIGPAALRAALQAKNSPNTKR